MGNINSLHFLNILRNKLTVVENELEANYNISESSLLERIKNKKKCLRYIPPLSQLPQPVYNILILLDNNFEGPFVLELKVAPCEIVITGFEGLIIHKIKKNEIIFIHRVDKIIFKVYSKSSEKLGGEIASKSDISENEENIILIVFKFTNSKDCESFYLLFPLIYGIIIYDNNVKIPLADPIPLNNYIVGQNEKLVNKFHRYSDVGKINDNNFEEEVEDQEALDRYEDYMNSHEGDFFTRNELLLNSTKSPLDMLLEDDNDEVNEDSDKKQYSKFFPISIEGDRTVGSIITYKDISPLGNRYKGEVIEWRLSTSIGGKNPEFSENPVSVSKTFQLLSKHVGRYIQVKVYRNIGMEKSEISYVCSETRSCVILPNEDILSNCALLLSSGGQYRVDISLYDICKLLCISDPDSFIKSWFANIRNIPPFISCYLNIKRQSVKLLIPTPSILLEYYHNVSVIPLCFGYNEFICTKKSDWFGFNGYPQIYSIIGKQGNNLERCTLYMSYSDGERRDIIINCPTERDRDVIHASIIFMQLAPDISLEKLNSQIKSNTFIEFKRYFTDIFTNANWNSRLQLDKFDISGTYINRIGVHQDIKH
ncbi:hypothetical protein cand_009170 [Cryptosporidium andersoni]|uniref:Uncharacterized protein n=1 Tax=Cryptosporidium andersoni TaxID=117008 RepID=A0A1J4MT58_9CRYT|nr:hypothetical protein cand_009170 [Cryptosporidium andersoni]